MSSDEFMSEDEFEKTDFLNQPFFEPIKTNHLKMRTDISKPEDQNRKHNYWSVQQIIKDFYELK